MNDLLSLMTYLKDDNNLNSDRFSYIFNINDYYSINKTRNNSQRFFISVGGVEVLINNDVASSFLVMLSFIDINLENDGF